MKRATSSSKCGKCFDCCLFDCADFVDCYLSTGAIGQIVEIFDRPASEEEQRSTRDRHGELIGVNICADYTSVKEFIASQIVEPGWMFVESVK